MTVQLQMGHCLVYFPDKENSPALEGKSGLLSHVCSNIHLFLLILTPAAVQLLGDVPIRASICAF